MTPEGKALDNFVNELDSYIDALTEDGLSWDEAVAQAKFEYDEFWRVLLEEAQNG